jgi:hypothetical protein
MWSPRGLDAKMVPVEFGPGARLHWFGRDAGIPTASVLESSLFRRFEIQAPGAHAGNTEVRWDQSCQRLLVGVWRGRRPNWQQPLNFPGPELCWFRSFYLPSHDGGLAQVRIARGVITIEVPSHAGAEAAGASHVPTQQVPSGPHAGNVVSLPRRREAAGYEGDSLAPRRSTHPSRVGVACRRLGVALCFALCLPVLLFSLFLFGFVLVPLLPFIAASFAWAMGRDEVPPPVRPNLPASARPTPAPESWEHAQAA